MNMTSKPKEVQIELAGMCNAACAYCDWRTRPRNQMILMETDLAKKVIAEARSLDVRQLTFHITGETLLHPDLLELLPQDHPILISTNCALLEGELADRLSRMANLLIILGVPWGEREPFRSRCIQNAFDYMMRRPLNRNMYIQIICDETSVASASIMLNQFKQFLDNPHVALHFKQPYTQQREHPTKGIIPQGIPIHPRIIVDNMYTPVSCGPDCLRFSPHPDTDILVQADGQIKPCFKRWDGWGLGNARDTTLFDAWNSPRFAEIRRIWHASDPNDELACGQCIRMCDKPRESDRSVSLDKKVAMPVSKVSKKERPMIDLDELDQAITTQYFSTRPRVRKIVAELRTARKINEYAAHAPSCAAGNRDNQTDPNCTCGLRELLSTND